VLLIRHLKVGTVGIALLLDQSTEIITTITMVGYQEYHTSDQMSTTNTEFPVTFTKTITGVFK
tara:strand:- start:233 stop:421 length:189 start_codon:yes stop_codon:yes gene_type:complete